MRPLLSARALQGWAVGSVKIPYYRVIKGRGFWCPNPKMRALGFQNVPCGPHGPPAWKVAQEWNERWQRALDRFTIVIDAKTSRADAAVYWRAYALSKVGGSSSLSAALKALGDLNRLYLSSSVNRNDAGNLIERHSKDEQSKTQNRQYEREQNASPIPEK